MEKNIYNNFSKIPKFKKEKNKKINFSQKKDNTIKSLSEVEYFLRNIKKIKDYIKLYKIIK